MFILMGKKLDPNGRKSHLGQPRAQKVATPTP